VDNIAPGQTASDPQGCDQRSPDGQQLVPNTARESSITDQEVDIRGLIFFEACRRFSDWKGRDDLHTIEHPRPQIHLSPEMSGRQSHFLVFEVLTLGYYQ
jgi:hypothetical protein